MCNGKVLNNDDTLLESELYEGCELTLHNPIVSANVAKVMGAANTSPAADTEVSEKKRRRLEKTKSKKKAKREKS